MPSWINVSREGCHTHRMGRTCYNEGHNEDHGVGRTHHNEIKDKATRVFPVPDSHVWSDSVTLRTHTRHHSLRSEVETRTHQSNY